MKKFHSILNEIIVLSGKKIIVNWIYSVRLKKLSRLIGDIQEKIMKWYFHSNLLTDDKVSENVASKKPTKIFLEFLIFFVIKVSQCLLPYEQIQLVVCDLTFSSKLTMDC